jgi:hypothetical protein
MMDNKKVTLKLAGDMHPEISVFTLFGNNEPVATSLLSYLLSCSESFFLELLRSLTEKPRHLKFKETKILREHISSSRSSKDRTDIELVSDNHFHIIFEAKIGNNIPSKQQCINYLTRLNSSVFVSLVLLVNDRESCLRQVREYDQDTSFLSERIQVLDWSTVRNIILRLVKQNTLGEVQPYFIEFWNFLERDYYMHSYQQEIMIVGIKNSFIYGAGSYSDLIGKTSEAGVFELNLYEGAGDKIKSVIYLAFRLNGMLQFISRVRQQKYLNNRMVFFLDKVITLPVVRKVPYAYRQGIQHTTFQRLLDPDIKDFKGLLLK